MQRLILLREIKRTKDLHLIDLLDSFLRNTTACAFRQYKRNPLHPRYGNLRNSNSNFLEGQSQSDW